MGTQVLFQLSHKALALFGGVQWDDTQVLFGWLVLVAVSMYTGFGLWLLAFTFMPMVVVASLVARIGGVRFLRVSGVMAGQCLGLFTWGFIARLFW